MPAIKTTGFTFSIPCDLTPSARKKERLELEQQLFEFLASGGEIEEIPTGVTKFNPNGSPKWCTKGTMKA